MALILAIESDKRQVNYLTAMVRGKLHAELVLGDTTEGALERLGDRVPDLILTSALLSPRDEQALGERLRKLNGVAAHVQMLTLPVFAQPSRQASSSRGGMLSALLGDRNSAAGPDGCDPAVFADQCKEYLRRSAEDREARQQERPPHLPVTVEPAIAEPLAVEATPAPQAEVVSDRDEVAVDIDLSDLLNDGPVETQAAPAALAVEEDEPAVYELSADSIELSAESIDVDLAAAPADEPQAPAASEPVEDDFNDWQKVIDALKRESAQVRVPREKKPNQRALQAALAPALALPAAPAPAPSTPKIAAEPPRRRVRPAADEWGMFDPTQAGMTALYERLEQISDEDEKR